MLCGHQKREFEFATLFSPIYSLTSTVKTKCLQKRTGSPQKKRELVISAYKRIVSDMFPQVFGFFRIISEVMNGLDFFLSFDKNRFNVGLDI